MERLKEKKKIGLTELCENCGLNLEAHCPAGHDSYCCNMLVPYNYCPGNQGKMNWDKGPGTIFKSTEKFGYVPYGTPAKKR